MQFEVDAHEHLGNTVKGAKVHLKILDLYDGIADAHGHDARSSRTRVRLGPVAFPRHVDEPPGWFNANSLSQSRLGIEDVT